MKNRFDETLYHAYRQVFDVDEVYFEQKTEHQHLIIFHNAQFGRVMALDGVIQTTEADEFIYHEMLAHVPILAHGQVRRVLIIGGGDGGLLREVARHRAVEQITMVEIDPSVTEMSKQYLPNHSQGAFDDPRLRLVFADGARFVAEDAGRYDVIIVDSTDPVGPGEVLFERPFYRDCKARLAPGGVIVTQNGVAFMQLDEAKSTAKAFGHLFADSHFYMAAVPTYFGGNMVFGWGTDDVALRQASLETIRERYRAAGIATRYYNPGVHVGAFMLPQFVLDAIGKEGNG
jgi:spermidine synthase